MSPESIARPRPVDEPRITVAERFQRIAERPDPARILAELRPPPRFAPKRFSNYVPAHPTQAEAVHRLSQVAARLEKRGRRSWLDSLRRPFAAQPSWIYLDGGFGVGKTHLLAALWNAAPAPKLFLSFDELMFLIGLAGPEPLATTLSGHTIIAVDEWELDDPGNLKMAVAFLRRIVGTRPLVAVTSNTLPLELGAGRFSQKDFRSEIEELAGAFEVIRIEGEDYRHRRFEADPGKDYLARGGASDHVKGVVGDRMLASEFAELQERLRSVHPIRYREIVREIDGVHLEGVTRIASIPDALRFVHFVDALYDSGAALAATGEIRLAALFEREALDGPYGKKLSRCLSRLEELLGGGGDVRPDGAATGRDRLNPGAGGDGAS